MNKACYENDRVLELVEKAKTTKDGPEREALYHEIQQIMYADLPYFGTYHMALYIGAQKGTGGSILFASGNHDYSHAYRLKTAE